MSRNCRFALNAFCSVYTYTVYNVEETNGRDHRKLKRYLYRTGHGKGTHPKRHDRVQPVNLDGLVNY